MQQHRLGEKKKKKRVNESLPSSFSPPGREASAAAPPSCYWGQRHPQVPWQQVPPWEHYANHEGEFVCVAEAYKAFIKNEFSSSQTCSLSQSQAALLTDGLHLSASVTLPDTVGYKWTNVCLQQNLIFMWFRNMKTEKVLNCSAKQHRRKEDSEHYSLNTPTLAKSKIQLKNLAMKWYNHVLFVEMTFLHLNRAHILFLIRWILKSC